MAVEAGPTDLPDSLLKPFLNEPNVLAHLIPAESTILPVKPVDYRGSVNKSSAPCTVEIDRLGVAKLYQEELGFTPAEVAEVEIYVIGDGNMEEIEQNPKKRKELFPHGSPKKSRLQKLLREEDTYAVSDVIKNKGVQENRALVIIYLSVLWSDFKKDKSTIIAYAKKRQKELTQPDITPAAKLSENDTNLLTVSNRMLSYLEKAPIDRVSKFLDRIGEIKARVDLLGSIVHEGAHIEEDRNKNRHPLLDKKWFIDVLYFLSRFNKRVDDFLEKKANQEEERVRDKPKWHSVVEFRVNQPDIPRSAQEPPKAA